MKGEYLLHRLRTRWRDRGNVVLDDSDYLATLNEAYREILTSHRWPMLEARATLVYVVGDSSVDLPTDVLSVTSVRNLTDGWLLKPFAHATQVREDHFYPDPAGDITTGPPRFYRCFGRAVEVFPQPTAATDVEVEYQVYPGDITAATEPVFPEPYHTALVDGALSVLYLDDGNDEKGTIFAAKFQTWQTKMVHDLLGQREDGYHVIAPEM